MSSTQDKDKFNLQIVVIGDEGVGKSSIVGHLIYLGGRIDPILFEQYHLDYFSINQTKPSRYSWVLKKLASDRKKHPPSYAPLTTPTKEKVVKIEEVENGIEEEEPWHIETENKMITIIDIPGNPNFVRNMITGASQAHAALLIVSCVDEELEELTKENSQTKSNLRLINALGIKHIIVGINKMDLVQYDENVFKKAIKIIKKLIETNFEPNSIDFIPISGEVGDNLDKSSENLNWYKGKSLLQSMDNLKPIQLEPSEQPLRVTVQDVFNLPGTGPVAIGKVESGLLKKEQVVSISPGNIQGKIEFIEMNNLRVESATPNNKVGVLISNVDHKLIRRGYIISDPNNQPCYAIKSFKAHIIVLSHFAARGRQGIKVNSKATLDAHNSHIESTFINLIATIDPKTGGKLDSNPEELLPGQSALVEIQPDKPLVMDKFAITPSIGRFAIRNKNFTLAVGVVVDVTKNED